MSNFEQNRRKNQIIAQRMVDKAYREWNASDQSDDLLWRAAITAARAHCRLRGLMGHSDKAAEAAHGLKALEELRLRGTQLELFHEAERVLNPPL